MSKPRLSRAERQAETRSALLDAAAAVFLERGLQGASIEAIVERAGYSRGAFYSNFRSKEQLFAELLQDRVYRGYRGMAERRLAAEGELPTARETGEELAAMQAHPDASWLFRLWLELLAHAGRDPELRSLASEFWRSNRRLAAAVVERSAAERGLELPVPADRIASALIALDIGLAVQHHVDPDAVPLDAYPQLFALLFDRL